MKNVMCMLVMLATLDAAAAEWVADRNRSKLGFTAIQQGAEFRGEFSRYSARLVLDENNLADARLEASIKLESVNTLNDERDQYLRQQDWFYVAMFPEARFLATDISRNEDGSYLAKGKLLLRGVTGSVPFKFTFEADKSKAIGQLVGSTQLNRLDYGVGQGDWENTEWVGDQVKITVDLYMLPEKP